MIDKYCCKKFSKVVEDDYNFTHYYDVIHQDPNNWYVRYYVGEANGDYYDFYKIKFCPFCGKKL